MYAFNWWRVLELEFFTKLWSYHCKQSSIENYKYEEPESNHLNPSLLCFIWKMEKFSLFFSAFHIFLGGNENQELLSMWNSSKYKNREMYESFSSFSYFQDENILCNGFLGIKRNDLHVRERTLCFGNSKFEFKQFREPFSSCSHSFLEV